MPRRATATTRKYPLLTSVFGAYNRITRVEDVNPRRRAA